MTATWSTWGGLWGVTGGILLGLGDSLVVYAFMKWLVERRPRRGGAVLPALLGMKLLLIFLILGFALKTMGFWPFMVLVCVFSIVRLIGLVFLGRLGWRNGGGKAGAAGEGPLS